MLACAAGIAAWQAWPSSQGPSSGPGASAGGTARRNIVLVLLDTVRADRLSCYGNERETTPALDALARAGARFEHAQSAAPWTIPSIASVWTGVLPGVHRAGVVSEPKSLEGKGSYRGFDEQALASLPTRLAARGYRNFAFVANPLLERVPCYLGDFDPAYRRVAYVKAKPIVEEVLGWLPELEQSQPFFLYVHLMDAHQPLDPPRRYRDLFPTDGEARGSKYETFGGLEAPDEMRSPLIPSFRENRLAVYDGALRFMDDQLARLFEELGRRGLADDTLIVVTADHGEEFWEHGVVETELYDCGARPHVGIGHGQSQFQELLAVPLIVAGPGVRAGAVVPTRVSLVDLGATLFDLALGEGDYDFGDGQSFGALVRGGSLPARPVVSEETSFGYELKALVQPDGLKYILALRAGERDCLFDLARDPLERENLLAARPDDARRLRAALEALVAEARARSVEPGPPADGSAAHLQALGYAGGQEEEEPKPRRTPQVIQMPKR